MAGEPSFDIDGNSRLDDPLTPDTGTGAVSYADRGAYEYQAAPLDHIAVTPGTTTIQAGISQAFTVPGFDDAGNPIGDVTASATLHHRTGRFVHRESLHCDHRRSAQRHGERPHLRQHEDRHRIAARDRGAARSRGAFALGGDNRLEHVTDICG